MTLAGQIQIELHHRQGVVTDVRIESSRPVNLGRVFQGQTPENVLQRVPLLFTLCRNAQMLAALTACRSALGLSVTVADDAAQQLLAHLETLREQAWRVLIDWPQRLGVNFDKSAMTTLLNFDNSFKRRLFDAGDAFQLDSHLLTDANIGALLDELTEAVDRHLFDNHLAEFLLIKNEAELHVWTSQNRSIPARWLTYLYHHNGLQLGSNAIACLPSLDPVVLDAKIRQDPDEFCIRPQWQLQCFESTPLTRQRQHPLMADLCGRYGNGVLTRSIARICEIAQLPGRMRRLAERLNDNGIVTADTRLDDGTGLAQVEAARGLLIHRLELKQGWVYDYRIVAPTEWNFHPDGVVAAGLMRLRGDSAELKRQAELWITAIDPCVQYTARLQEEG